MICRALAWSWPGRKKEVNICEQSHCLAMWKQQVLKAPRRYTCLLFECSCGEPGLLSVSLLYHDFETRL